MPKKALKKLIHYDTCDFCRKNETPPQPLSSLNNYYEDDERKVCKDCLNDEELFGTCCICEEKFLLEDMVVKGGYLYCKEHEDEGCMDKEETEDIYDIIEDLNK